jgi:hypothetical protein
MRRGLGILTAAATLALAPGAAHGATLAVDQACYLNTAEGNEQVNVTGSGFAPPAGGTLSLSVDGTFAGSGRVDAAGALTAAFPAPSVLTGKPKAKTVTLSTTDPNPANAAQVSFGIATLAVKPTPAHGNPRRFVRYSATGFKTGGRLYGHYLFGGRLRGTHDFGPLSGPCGVRRTRARLLPVRPVRDGTWTIQFDTVRTYTPNPPLGVRANLTITTFVRPR